MSRSGLVSRRRYQESSTATSPLVSTGARFSTKQARALWRLRSITCRVDTNAVSQRLICEVVQSWNNGKSGAKLVLTSSTTPGLQIHKFDHSRTANPCDWLLCRRAALPLVGCPHSIVYLHLPVVEGLIFCILATPHLGTSFPLFHALIQGK